MNVVRIYISASVRCATFVGTVCFIKLHQKTSRVQDFLTNDSVVITADEEARYY